MWQFTNQLRSRMSRYYRAIGYSMAPMLEVAKRGGTCGGKGPPAPPPCPVLPPQPFNWFYIVFMTIVASFLSLLYKYWLYLEASQNSNKPAWVPRNKLTKPPSYLDVPPCVQYLIIGTGAAAWAAYQGIRDSDPEAKVFFVSKEDAYPYSRMEMSKRMWYNGLPPNMNNLEYIFEGKPKSMYYTDCKDFFDPAEFNLMKGPAVSIALGWCIRRIDADEHVAYLDTPCGEIPIYYDRCLFAPGLLAKNLKIFSRAPKFVRESSTTLRTIRDLEAAYRKVVAAKHVTIIGGGPLGCELAYYMGRMQDHWYPKPEDPEYKQPEILLIFKDKGVLSGVLPEYLGEWAAEKIKCENVNILPSTQVYDAFETKDHRLQLTLSNGTSITTDYVLVAVGTEPNIEIAERSFLETDPVNGGFLVNTEFLARQHLYIAGDAASYYSQWKNQRMRVEHALNAEQEGYIAGCNMAGYWVPNNYEPHWWIKLGMDINMQVVGDVGACMPTVAIFKPCDLIADPKDLAMDEGWGELKRPCFKESHDYRNRYRRGILFYIRDETVVGLVFWNFEPVIEDRYEVATELLRARPSYKDINLLAELLGFPDMICVNELPAKPTDLPKYPCIDKSISKFMDYEETQELHGLLSVHEGPKKTFYMSREQLEAVEAEEKQARLAELRAEALARGEIEEDD